MKRFRWLRADWPISMRTLSKRLKARPFDSAVTHGFVIDRVREEFLEGRYVERIEYTETITDPFGIELSFDRIEFRQSSFRATPDGPGLELRNPPRSVQSLLNRLSEAADFDVAITPHTIDVLAWSTRFHTLSGLKSVVDSLQLNSVALEPGIQAKIVIKGDRDVRAACAALTNQRKHTLEKIRLRLDTPSSGVIILGSTASASLGIDDPTDQMLQSLRDALSETGSASSSSE